MSMTVLGLPADHSFLSETSITTHDFAGPHS
jgi:hypothetical protein